MNAKPDNHERRSRDTRPQPAWRNLATPCKAALLLALSPRRGAGSVEKLSKLNYPSIK